VAEKVVPKETSAVQKIGLTILGVAIAVASAVAWKYWNIDGFFAVMGVLTGLGMAASALGYTDPSGLL
jgi:hypothetical protein